MCIELLRLNTHSNVWFRKLKRVVFRNFLVFSFRLGREVLTTILYEGVNGHLRAYRVESLKVYRSEQTLYRRRTRCV
jgi:hypothetical protein